MPNPHSPEKRTNQVKTPVWADSTFNKGRGIDNLFSKQIIVMFAVGEAPSLASLLEERKAWVLCGVSVFSLCPHGLHPTAQLFLPLLVRTLVDISNNNTAGFTVYGKFSSDLGAACTRPYMYIQPGGNPVGITRPSGLGMTHDSPGRSGGHDWGERGAWGGGLCELLCSACRERMHGNHHQMYIYSLPLNVY